jgi:hypothetical protein
MLLLESRSETPGTRAGKLGRLHPGTQPSYCATSPKPGTVDEASRASLEAFMSKRSEKPKKLQKKQPQKTLKERRSEKRAATKFGSG